MKIDRGQWRWRWSTAWRWSQPTRTSVVFQTFVLKIQSPEPSGYPPFTIHAASPHATAFPARPRLRPHAGPALARRYERRRPEKTPLHRVVSDNLEGSLVWREAAERPVTGYVEEELRGYLERGILSFGFARALCTGCGQAFVVAFSCKRRDICPSCDGRHMAQTAAHLADHVITPVLVRQWVISVPKPLRGILADSRQKGIPAGPCPDFTNSFGYAFHAGSTTSPLATDRLGAEDHAQTRNE